MTYQCHTSPPTRADGRESTRPRLALQSLFSSRRRARSGGCCMPEPIERPLRRFQRRWRRRTRLSRAGPRELTPWRPPGPVGACSGGVHQASTRRPRGRSTAVKPAKTGNVKTRVQARKTSPGATADVRAFRRFAPLIIADSRPISPERLAWAVGPATRTTRGPLPRSTSALVSDPCPSARAVRTNRSGPRLEAFCLAPETAQVGGFESSETAMPSAALRPSDVTKM